MKALRYIIAIGFIGLIAFTTCSKDETEAGDSTTRSAAVVNDSTENDSTSGGNFLLDTDWVDSMAVNF